MSVASERREWDAKAPDLERARRAIWDNDSPTNDERIKLMADLIVPALEPVLRQSGARILDLGCGVGDLTLAIARHFPRAFFIGVDISEEMLRLARSQPKDRATVRYVLGDGRTLPRVGQLDGAWSTVMMQHIPNEAKRGYLAEVADRLTPGGVFRFQWVEGDWEPAGDAHETDVAAWCEAAGLRVEAMEPGSIFETWRWTTAVKP